MRKIFFIIFLTLASAGVALRAQAAEFSLVAPGSLTIGSTTQVHVQLDTQSALINTIDFHGTFSSRDFVIQNVSDGNSLMNLWIAQPSFSNATGSISFSGIIPGGYQGSDGDLLTLTITPRKNLPWQLSAQGSSLFLNDGQGSSTTVASAMPVIILAATSLASTSPANATLPETFVPRIGRDATIYNNEYFLSFATTDKGSGIDHYEVLEVPSGTPITTTTTGWVRATSPYVLHDQTLHSDIYVRAVDYAGNATMVEVPAPFPVKSFPYDTVILWLTCLLLSLILVLLMMRWFAKKSPRKNTL